MTSNIFHLKSFFISKNDIQENLVVKKTFPSNVKPLADLPPPQQCC
eukprot:UN24285